MIKISIHAPRVGRDGMASASIARVCSFQSTRPVWGATRGGRRSLGPVAISIHAPRVGRDAECSLAASERAISIHAPRVGRDFLHQTGLQLVVISIHAPRVGRDPY